MERIYRIGMYAHDPGNDSLDIKIRKGNTYKNIKIGLGLKSRGCDEIMNLRFGLK